MLGGSDVAGAEEESLGVGVALAEAVGVPVDVAEADGLADALGLGAVEEAADDAVGLASTPALALELACALAVAPCAAPGIALGEDW